MSQSSWIVQKPDPYEVPYLLTDRQIEKVMQNLKISNHNQDEVEIELRFGRQSDLQLFQKLHEQQIFEDENDFSDSEKSRQENKFKRVKDINQKQYEVRQLAFPSYHFVNIFMRIYEVRLKQLQIQYQYRFFMHRNKFRVYIPKGQKISAFFKNQIFEMKMKLNLYYSNNPTVVDKIKYSDYFNRLIEKQSIAAEYHQRTSKIDVAIFYSNTHEKKKIIQIVNKNLLEHMTILDLTDKTLKIETNQIIFKLLSSLLSQKIKIIRKQTDTKVQFNQEKCCILVHDRHECFNDAQKQIMQAVGQTLAFKFQGQDMRTLCNKVLRNKQKYSFLRVKYKHRAFYCIVDCAELLSNRKHLSCFIELLEQYFQNFTQENNITFYLKLSNYDEFLNFYFSISEGKNVTILNINEFTLQKDSEKTKFILGVKSLGLLNVIQTRKNLLEIFLKIFLKTSSINGYFLNYSVKFQSAKGILGFENESQVSAYLSQSICQNSKSEIKEQSNQEKQTAEKVDAQNLPQLSNKTSVSYKYKQRQKKPKHIDITCQYKPVEHQPGQQKFWDQTLRQRKIEHALRQNYKQYFGRLRFKAFTISLKQKTFLPSIQEIQVNKIYISTILQKNNEICHHFIDLNQFSRLCNEIKDKIFFIFYKLLDKQVYVPSYALILE